MFSSEFCILFGGLDGLYFVDLVVSFAKKIVFPIPVVVDALEYLESGSFRLKEDTKPIFRQWLALLNSSGRVPPDLLIFDQLCLQFLLLPLLNLTVRAHVMLATLALDVLAQVVVVEIGAIALTADEWPVELDHLDILLLQLAAEMFLPLQLALLLLDELVVDVGSAVEGVPDAAEFGERAEVGAL